MKISKKVIILLIICLLLVLLAFFIGQTYAKYMSSISGDASISISRWNIKVNSQTIKTNPDISATITPVFPGNDNIAEGIIAPTAEGYFDLVFDFTDVDVSFKYVIDVTADESSAVKDLVSTGYSVDGGDKITFDTTNSPITNTIKLSDNITTRTIRVYIKWNDDEATQSMNNIDDTNSTLQSDSSAVLKVNVSFTQVANSSTSEDTNTI